VYRHFNSLTDTMQTGYDPLTSRTRDGQTRRETWVKTIRENKIYPPLLPDGLWSAPGPSCPVGARGFSRRWGGQGREADHSPPSSADIGNEWSYTSTLPYVFTAWYLFMQGANLSK